MAAAAMAIHGVLDVSVNTMPEKPASWSARAWSAIASHWPPPVMTSMCTASVLCRGRGFDLGKGIDLWADLDALQQRLGDA